RLRSGVTPVALEGSSVPLTTIRPASGFDGFRLRELWDRRELLYFLVWRDVKVRYKQTALGAAWAILQPLLTMIAFSVFFGRLAHPPSDGRPYPVFVYAALVPWSYFSATVGQAANSLVDNAQLVTKIYFPRLLVPTAPVIAGLLDFGIAFVVLLALWW